jgi:hypothetical protein
LRRRSLSALRRRGLSTLRRGRLAALSLLLTLTLSGQSCHEEQNAHRSDCPVE